MNFFKERLKNIEAIIIPTKPLQSQTFLLVSLLLFLGSTLISLGANGDKQLSNILSSLSWLFLTIGIGFLTSEKLVFGKFNPSPWITGAMLCFFLYQNVANEIKSFIIIMWPLISLSIGELTIFVKNGGKLQPSPPLTSKNFSFMLLINLLLTCWFSFHFVIQEWGKQYPSLFNEDVSKSAFVIRTKSSSLANSRGAIILNLIEQQLKQDVFAGELEMSVEKMKLKLIDLKFKALEKLGPAKENKYWLLETPIIASNSGYKIELQLIWEGPTIGKEAYYLSKSCEIQRQVSTPSSTDRPNNRATSAELPQIVNIVNCGPVERKALKKSTIL